MPADVALLAGIFAGSGATHLLRPSVFDPLVPSWLPAHRELIVVSGAAELLCAAGLALPRTRRTAGLLSAALLVAVWPGNVQMALDAARKKRRPAYRLLTLARLPLQLPMIRTALRAR
jgi:uncharacterized membrane protein